jgi:hypothetical protein
VATFRQTLSTPIAAGKTADLLAEGSAGTPTNGAPAVLIALENTGANLLDTITLLIDPTGSGDFVPSTAGGTALSGIAAGTSKTYTMLERPWAFRLQGTTTLGTSVKSSVAGVHTG